MAHLKNLGLHIAYKPEDICRAREAGFNVFQVFLGSPQKAIKDYKALEDLYLERKRFMPLDIQLIVHGHYWFNLVKGGHWLTRLTLIELQKQLDLAKKLGATHYVTHVGYRNSKKEMEAGKEISNEQALGNLYMFCKALVPYLEFTGIQFCLENSAGTKAGTLMGSVDDLMAVITSLNYPLMGICWDTQHAWARGDLFGQQNAFLINYEKQWAHVKAIHLNPNPGTSEGGFKDRHSSITLEESRGYGGHFFNAVVLATEPVRPIVLERYCLELCIKDKLYLERIIDACIIPKDANGWRF